MIALKSIGRRRAAWLVLALSMPGMLSAMFVAYISPGFFGRSSPETLGGGVLALLSCLVLMLMVAALSTVHFQQRVPGRIALALAGFLAVWAGGLSFGSALGRPQLDVWFAAWTFPTSWVVAIVALRVTSRAVRDRLVRRRSTPTSEPNT